MVAPRQQRGETFYLRMLKWGLESQVSRYQKKKEVRNVLYVLEYENADEQAVS